MPSLVPVDHDPFNGGTGSVKLVPVDHNPFDYSGVGAAMPEAYGANSPIEDILGKAVVSAVTLPKRAMDASEKMVRTGEYDAPTFLEAAMLPMGTGAIAGVPLRAGESALGAGPIRAYHGSPHDFDKFSLDKIGTGEGAQAYGHGLYFADNEGVAQSYRDTLSSPYAFNDDQIRRAFASDLPLEVAHIRDIRNAAADTDVSVSDAAKRIQWRDPGLRGERGRSGEGTPYHEPLARAIQHVRDGAKGRMYEVNINADAEHFLDWDKPLSQQHPAVQEAIGLSKLAQKPTPEEVQTVFKLAKERGVPASELPEYKALEARLDSANQNSWETIGIPPPNVHMRPEEIPGSMYYQGLATGDAGVRHLSAGAPGGPDVSKRLSDRGIPGIKYLDQGSRGTGEGSHNYVVFDQDLINIVRKYAVAGMALPPAIAAEYARQFKPVEHDPFASELAQ